MMNFKAISSIQDQTSRLSERRRQKSEELCHAGFRLLFEAETRGFADKSLLSQASDAFADAIAQDRLAPDAYFGMGYLLFLLKDYPLAMRYLREALRLQPEHPDARDLLQQLHSLDKQAARSGPAPGPAPAARPLPPPPAEPDYDALYEEVEALIMQEVHRLASEKLPIPSLQASAQRRLHQGLQRQQELIRSIQRQIDVIEVEIETDALRAKLKPLEVAVRRYQQAVSVSDEMLEIQQSLVGLLDRLPELSDGLVHARTAAELAMPLRLVEVMMDRCDQLADRLDFLDQKKHPVKALIEMYEHLVSEVEALHEQSDDLAEQLR